MILINLSAYSLYDAPKPFRFVMATYPVDGKDIPLGSSFPGNAPRRSRHLDVFESALEQFYNTEFGKMLKDFNLESLLVKLRAGDIKTIAICSITILCFGLSYLVLKEIGAPVEKEEKPKEEEVEKIEQRDFTVEQLRDYDGKGEQPIYIALKGDVFDVSSAREFYGEGSGYNCFAGREATRAMAKLSFEESDLCNPNIDDLGPFEKGNLDDWYSKFKDYKCYPIIGKISQPSAFHDYTISELLTFKECLTTPSGRINAPILMGISGKVIDVSFGGKDMYGKGGPYFLFAGIDASKALAKMSFKEEDLNSRDLSDLTPEQLKTLKDWETKFIISRKYPVVGNIIA